MWPFRRETVPGFEGAPRASVSRMHTAAGPDGRLWMAGEDERGQHLFVFEGANGMREIAGFEKLIGVSRIGAVTVGADGRVYLGTDGAGVIVFDGNQWRPHAVNSHLPRLSGSRLRPAEGLLPLADGRLCVSIGPFLLIE